MRHLCAFIVAATLSAAPQRIVSTGPSITEILFALGLGPRVVGVTQYCNFPPEAQKIKRIGSWMTPNMEAILKTRPDLVIVQKTGIHDDSRMKAMSLKTMLVHLNSIDDILKSIGEIGAATGADAQAAQLTKSITRELEAIRKRSRAGNRPASCSWSVEPLAHWKGSSPWANDLTLPMSWKWPVGGTFRGLSGCVSEGRP